MARVFISVLAATLFFVQCGLLGIELRISSCEKKETYNCFLSLDDSWNNRVTEVRGCSESEAASEVCEDGQLNCYCFDGDLTVDEWWDLVDQGNRIRAGTATPEDFEDERLD